MRAERRLPTLRVSFALLLSMSLAGTAGALDRPAASSEDSARLWVRSASGATSQVVVTRNQAEERVPLAAAEWTEVALGGANETVGVKDGGDLLLLKAPDRFDRTAIEIQAASPRPAAAAQVLRRNEQVSSAVAWKRGPLPVHVAFLAPDSSVDLQLLSAGRPAGFVNLSSSKPVAVEIDLRSLVDRRAATGPFSVQLRVQRGEVTGSLEPWTGRFRRTIAGKTNGTAYVSDSINWSFNPTLYYYISGGPASTCGQLETYRNGSWLYSPGWACTDAGGSVTKGPWSWYSTYADQTDDPLYIRWPDGTTTNTDTHIWDKTCPSVNITSTYGSPPSNYYGTATDGQWGACFNAGWTYVYSYFIDTTGPGYYYWNDSTHAYSSTNPYTIYGSVSGMPSCGVSWSTAYPTSHTSGHSYFWQTCISDGGCVTCNAISFTVP